MPISCITAYALLEKEKCRYCLDCGPTLVSPQKWMQTAGSCVLVSDVSDDGS